MLQEILESGEYGLLYSRETGDLYVSEDREVFLVPLKTENLSISAKRSAATKSAGNTQAEARVVFPRWMII